MNKNKKDKIERTLMKFSDDLTYGHKFFLFKFRQKKKMRKFITENKDVIIEDYSWFIPELIIYSKENLYEYFGESLHDPELIKQSIHDLLDCRIDIRVLASNFEMHNEIITDTVLSDLLDISIEENDYELMEFVKIYAEEMNMELDDSKMLLVVAITL